jgi:hypothetical protein
MRPLEKVPFSKGLKQGMYYEWTIFSNQIGEAPQKSLGRISGRLHFLAQLSVYDPGKRDDLILRFVLYSMVC